MALRALGVHAAELTAATPVEAAAATLAALDDPASTLRLLFVTPEKVIKSRRFFAKLEKAYKAGLLRRVAVDEAHCISQWGADFRVDYTKLHVLKEQFPKAPLMALTATATADVQSSICDALGVPGAARFQASVARPNLRYEVRAKPGNATAHVDDLAALIRERYAPSASGIVYCLTRKATEVVAAELRARGISALAYHAQMENDARISAHRSWAAGRTRVMCSSVAFGMGINKLDVRFVIHHSISKSVETYYQESGRAGRDGAAADCVAYFRPADFWRQAGMVFFEAAGLRRLFPLIRVVLARRQCRHALIAAHFGEAAPASCGTACDVCSAASPPDADANLTAHAAALLATARELEASDRSASCLQLVDHWRKSAASERATLARELTPEDAELLVSHLVILSVLRLDFASNAFATNVYIKAGTAAPRLEAGLLSVHLPLRLAPKARSSAGAAKRKRPAGKQAAPECAAAAALCTYDDEDFE